MFLYLSLYICFTEFSLFKPILHKGGSHNLKKLSQSADYFPKYRVLIAKLIK